jgi:S-formylglutathione hydrolase
MTFTTDATIATFGGKLLKLTHQSSKTNTPMNVNVYLPKQYESASDKSIPVLLYLSGLTCTPNNASEKAFWQPYADKYGFAVVFPDTSPRGAGSPGEDDSWDFGTGAGFYVDAKTEGFKKHYNMYSYVHQELQPLLAEEFQKLNFDKVSITGHSMGGFGALSGYLQNPGKYQSVSAFAPISNPINAQWGQKNFSGYLGDDKEAWKQYDPTELLPKFKGDATEILIHVGKADPFYYRDHQLLPENLVEASKGTAFENKINLNLVEGFDHSYYFISSFVEQHAKHHAKYLGLESKL